jgi:hypothetical protein
MTFNASDNGVPVQSASKQITIIVSRQNHAPVLDPIRDKESPIRVKLEFSIKATDQDGDALVYSATGLPFSNGATFNPYTRTFIWAPTAIQAGTYPVRFEVSDGNLSDFEDVDIIISANEAPVFDPLFDQSVRVNKRLCFAVIARDPNNDLITYAAAVLPEGARFDADTHTFTWVPQAGQEGWHDAEFTASDSMRTTNLAIRIYVNYAGAPELEFIDVKYVKAGQTLAFRLNASDPGNLPLAYSVSGLPANYTLTGPDFSWTPFSNQVGAYKDVIFTASNGTYSDSKLTWVYVVPNNAPVIEQIAQPYVGKRIVEGRTLSFTVKATDPNGDPLTYWVSNLPAGAVFNTANNTFTWTPTTGEAGVYRDIVFSVSDGTNTVSENIWIFVDANDAPIIEDVMDQRGKPGELISFGISAYDSQGDTLSYRALNLPLGATFRDRTFRWIPAPGQVGTYPNITFEVSDGTSIVNKKVFISVIASGAPTIYVPGEIYVGHQVKAADTLQFIVSATDPDTPLSALAFTAANLPPGSIFVDNHNGTASFSWTPTQQQIGTYPYVGFTVSDGASSDSKDTWIFVIASGAPQFAQGLPDIHGKVGEPIVFNVLATDPDNQLLAYEGINLPRGAALVGQTFTWTPQAEQAGTYPHVRIEVRDPDNNVAADTFWIFIAGNTAPQLDFIGTKYGVKDQPLTFTIAATDIGGDALTYSASNLPAGAAFDPTSRQFRWTPQAAGTYENIHFTVSDGTASDSENISIVVSP